MNSDTRMDTVERVTPLDGSSATLDNLTKTEHGPLLVLFCLFVVGFGMCTGGIILVVLSWRHALALLFLVPIFGVVVEASERLALKIHKAGSRSSIWNDTAKLVILLGWLIPRKHREAILGDILEDCHEMRERGLAERRIWTIVLWQWVISVVTLIPASIIGAIVRLLGAK